MTSPQPPDPDEQLFQQAVAAAHQVLANRGQLAEEATADALRAAMKVYDDDRDAYVQRQLDNTRFLGMDVDDGLLVRLVMAEELAANLVLACKTLLEPHSTAENYIENTVVDRETGDRYAFIVVRPGGRTPHQLRRAAEDEAARLRAELEEARAAAGAQ